MYTTFYGLRLKPFENTPDTRFLFPSKSHREILASLRYGVENSKGFILIAGDVGTGKTTMIYALLKGIDSSYIIFNFTNPKWTFDELIKYLAFKLKVNVKGKDKFQIRGDLKIRLEKLNYYGKRVVLIFDEAHLLPESNLQDIRLISNFEKENKKLVQIVLVGQKEIYQTLQKDSLNSLKQRIVINRNLEPLSKKESNNYINHRLRIAGGQSQIFSKKAFALIWKRSRGVPRLINHICDNAMLIGYASEAKIIGSKVVKEVINDMDSGHKNLKAPKFLRYRNLKWAGASAAFVILIALIAAYFINFKSIDVNDGSQEGYLSANQSEDLSISEGPPIKESKANLELQEPLSHEPEKLSEVVTPSEPDHSIIITDNDTSDKDAGSDSTNTVSVEEPKGQIASSPLPKENVIAKKTAEKLIFIKKVVKRNDILSEIASQTYGLANDTVIDLIHTANPGIQSVDRIYVGQPILLPLIQKENLIALDENGKYHIHYASFYSSSGASRCVEELSDKAQRSIVIIPINQQENRVYRVYYGNFNRYEEARKALEHLQLKYHSFLN